MTEPNAQTAPNAPHIPGYQYVRPLGRGGFARVYLYEQDMPRRQVAVKVLSKSFGEMRRAFETEADMMAKLSSHPSIVAIYGASLSADGLPYLVMEFCPGSLGARAKNSPLPLAEVLDVGVRLAGALETAHRSGVLHRDIKPSNVLQTVTGKPALTDFGIADLVDRDTSEQREMALSIPWSAPEVVNKIETGTVASEIWSLGATLYTLASGRSPFATRVVGKKDTQKALVKEITKAEYLAIEGAVGYEPFDAVLARSMAKNPADRFSSMAEFGRELQQLQRYYRNDVTPLEIIEQAWIAHAPPSEPAAAETAAAETAAAAAPRGPHATTVGHVKRSERRQQALREHAQQESGTTSRPRLIIRDAAKNKTLVTVVISVLSTTAVLGLGLVIARVLGWL